MRWGFATMVCVGILACSATDANAARPEDFSVFNMANPAGGTPVLPGRLYVPPEAAQGPRPLIVFLHGAGEAGTNNTLQVNANIDNLFAEAKRRGAFLYAPQSRGDWSSKTLTDNVMSMLDRALSEQSVDGTRLYVTGLSNGGGGTWNMMSRYGERFAAAIPICGIAPAGDYAAANLVDEPIWAFHARNDSTVSVNNTRNRVNSVLDLQGESRPTYPTVALKEDFDFTSTTLDWHYTEYYTGNHGIWGRVYNTPAVYDWLFAHTAAVPEPSGVALLLLGSTALMRRRVATRRMRQ